MRDRFDIFKELCAAADRGDYTRGQELIKELLLYLEARYGKRIF